MLRLYEIVTTIYPIQILEQRLMYKHKVLMYFDFFSQFNRVYVVLLKQNLKNPLILYVIW